MTWTSRTTGAPWAARWAHTSVVDAAGAIYVIGGNDGEDRGGTDFNDVWVSTDGGARPDLVTGCSGWVLGGGYWVYLGYYRGYYRGTRGYSVGTIGVLQGYSGNHRVLSDSIGVLQG